MAPQYNYFTSQEDFTREARIRVYAYERYPSREKIMEDRDRYPSVYKLFNNRPCFGDASAGARMSQPPVMSREIIHPKAHSDESGWVTHRSISPHPDVGNQTHVPSQHHVVTHPSTYPKTVESVNYCDTGRLSPSPRSPQPHVGIQTLVPLDKGKLVGNKTQTPVPSQPHVVTHPKGSPQNVESVKYGDTSRVNESPHSPQPYGGIQTDSPREKARLVGREKEIGHDDKKQEGNLDEEQCVDAAAAGFIEWKLRTLKLCKA